MFAEWIRPPRFYHLQCPYRCLVIMWQMLQIRWYCRKMTPTRLHRRLSRFLSLLRLCFENYPQKKRIWIRFRKNPKIPKVIMPSCSVSNNNYTFKLITYQNRGNYFREMHHRLEIILFLSVLITLWYLL